MISKPGTNSIVILYNRNLGGAEPFGEILETFVIENGVLSVPEMNELSELARQNYLRIQVREDYITVNPTLDQMKARIQKWVDE